MRINVYSQELEKTVELVRKGEYFGVRIFFDGSSRLHYRYDDDDRSAITYWVPNGETFTPTDLAEVFESAAILCRSI